MAEEAKAEDPIKPCVIVGPSGVGKGTILGKFKETYGGISKVAVSHTTRDKREGEEDGVHYNFVTVEQFETLIDASGFVEYAKVHGNYYGTSKKAIKDAQKGGICFLEIDFQGSNALKDSDIECNYIFFTCTGGLDELQNRLHNRKSETPESIKRRLATAKSEFDQFEKSKDYFNFVIKNDDLDVAVGDFTSKMNELYPSLIKL